MGKWVVTVAGIAIFSVLCDVILPEGQTRKYVKTVFGVVVTLVIVQPVIQLFNGDFSGIFTSSNGSTTVQQQYIESVADRKLDNALKSITTILENNGVEVKDVTVSENTVVVRLNVSYSKQAESTVKTVVSAYLADYDIITMWK